YNLAPFPAKLSYAGNRDVETIVQRFDHDSTRQSVRADLALIDALDRQVGELESYLVRTVRVDDAVAYHLLRTVPGVGKVIALILLYEVHRIDRFGAAGNFLSYARLVRCAHESAGKVKGYGCTKIGNG